MVQNQVEVTVQRTQRDMMRPADRRHHNERPRYLARDAHSEQKEHHELATAHRALDTLRLDGGQPLPSQI